MSESKFSLAFDEARKAGMLPEQIRERCARQAAFLKRMGLGQTREAKHLGEVGSRKP